MHGNWQQLAMQLMVNEAWLFTFYHWTHGCDVSIVKNYLNFHRIITGVLNYCIVLIFFPDEWNFKTQFQQKLLIN